MISKFIFSWLMYFFMWLGFTSTFQWQEMATGGAVTLIIAVFTTTWFTKLGLKFLIPKRLINVIRYLFVFLAELVKANLNVARIVVHPKLPIHPGIVKFDTTLNSEMAKMLLANSITLTPGTLTVDIVDNTFYIHWLEVSTSKPEESYREIAEKFEKILKEIFE